MAKGKSHADSEPTGRSEQKQPEDAGATPGRNDPMQASGEDAPLPAVESGKTSGSVANPSPTVGGSQQSGPLSGKGVKRDADNPDNTPGGTVSPFDIFAAAKDFIAAVRTRDVAKMLKSASVVLGSIAEMFTPAGDGPQVWSGSNPAEAKRECDKLLQELAACKGEASSATAEFANPSFHTQRGVAAGSAPGMAATGPTAPVGIDPAMLMTLFELVMKAVEWFRNRNKG